MTLCTVCVATYHRPQLLEKLLESLVNQQLPDDVSLELIVVDNDAEGSGKPTFDKFAHHAEIQLHYFVQPVKNISLTRNTAVCHAMGEYLLFIDDDEAASPKWVMNMLSALVEHNADAVFGRVISEFNSEAPEWIKKSYLFHRPCPPTGSIAAATRTSNCLVKASLLKALTAPFDPAYGITGGEDTHLFDRLKKQGATFVVSYEGWVSEFIPPERTNPKWLLKRAFRTGNLFTRRSIALAESNQLMTRLKSSVKAVYFLVSLLMMILVFPVKHRRFHWKLKAAANLGGVLAVFGYQIDGY